MEKPDDWRIRISEFVIGRIDAPFEWAENDCGTFVADAVVAACGIDPAKRWRGTYSGEDDAPSVDEILAEIGEPFEEVAPSAMSFGDFGLVRRDGVDRALFALRIQGSVCAPGPRGLLIHELDQSIEVERAWTYPRGGSNG